MDRTISVAAAAFSALATFSMMPSAVGAPARPPAGVPLTAASSHGVRAVPADRRQWRRGYRDGFADGRTCPGLRGAIGAGSRDYRAGYRAGFNNAYDRYCR